LRAGTAAASGGVTAGKIAARDIGERYGVSHCTARNAPRRLTTRRIVTPLRHESGSAESRRYRLSAEALRR
jgi:hypothetical protein